MHRRDIRDWGEVYRRYRTLERNWSVPGTIEPVARQLFRTLVHSWRNRTLVLREFDSFGLDAPPKSILAEGLELKSILNPEDGDVPGGRAADDPLESVYAAALSMAVSGFWRISEERDQLYRGQRNASWHTTPSLFRSAEPSAMLTKLGAAIARIRMAKPELSEEQALAVAQHYSKELDVATWLLDVTYDPNVALFFASHGGITGDLGVVNCIMCKEWRRLSAGGRNRLGRLRVIDVPGVLRIDRQKASFLDTSHRELFEQYVAHAIWFRQETGVHFEDRDAENPISEGDLYPQQDPLLEQLAAVPTTVTGMLNVGPESDALKPLGATAYLDIAESWCREQEIELDLHHRETLRVVSEVHADLQQQSHEFDLPERSLHRLWDAAKNIIDAQRHRQMITPAEALRFSLCGFKPEPRKKFEALIDKHAPTIFKS